MSNLSTAVMDTNLWISAQIKVQDGKSPVQVKEALDLLAQATQGEPGCIRFEVYQDNEMPGLFILWEQWKNEAALADHFDAKHTKDFLDQGFTELVHLNRMHSI